MKTWDFNSGVSVLEDAFETLQALRRETSDLWSDETSRKFQEAYLDPLEPKVRRVVDAIHGLAEVLQKAQRDCTDV